MKRTVQVETRSTVEISADQMGLWFSEMDDQEQVDFLISAVENMSRWPSQWDAIAVKLNEPENHETRAVLRTLMETIL